MNGKLLQDFSKWRALTPEAIAQTIREEKPEGLNKMNRPASPVMGVQRGDAYEIRRCAP